MTVEDMIVFTFNNTVWGEQRRVYCVNDLLDEELIRNYLNRKKNLQHNLQEVICKALTGKDEKKN